MPNNHTLYPKPVLELLLDQTHIPNYWALGPLGCVPVSHIEKPYGGCRKRCRTLDSLPRPSFYPLLYPKDTPLKTLYRQLRVQGGAWETLGVAPEWLAISSTYRMYGQNERMICQLPGCFCRFQQSLHSRKLTWKPQKGPKRRLDGFPC